MIRYGKRDDQILLTFLLSREIQGESCKMSGNGCNRFYPPEEKPGYRVMPPSTNRLMPLI